MIAWNVGNAAATFVWMCLLESPMSPGMITTGVLIGLSWLMLITAHITKAFVGGKR